MYNFAVENQKLKIITTKHMSQQELANRKGCNKRVLLFFVFAIACVAAFLIIGLVRTCDTDHEEKNQSEIQQEQVINQNPNQ